MKPSLGLVLSLTVILPASAQTLPSLLDALRASGASLFADQIDADSTIAALYLSDQVQTVFAPIDDAYASKFARLEKRQNLTAAQQQALLLQSTQGQATLQSMRSLPGGSKIVTQDHVAKLNGSGQSVISDARPKNTTKATKATKRDFSRPLYPPTWIVSAPYPPTPNASEPYPPNTWTASESYPPKWTTSASYSPVWTSSTSYSPVWISSKSYSPVWTSSKSYPPPSAPSPSYSPVWTSSTSYSPVWTSSTSYPPPSTPSPSSLVELFSGLGNSVNVIRADIPYAGGLIQITDGQFTLPVSLSATLQVTGQTTFESLASSANLTDALDNIPTTTFFIPSNEAFANANNATATAALLQGHVIPNFLGYLPSLVNGSTLTTQAGSFVTVTIQGNNYFINDAMIVSSNLILDNGVAHVIDKVLPPSIQVFLGAASSTIPKGTVAAFTAAIATSLFLAVLF